MTKGTISEGLCALKTALNAKVTRYEAVFDAFRILPDLEIRDVSSFERGIHLSYRVLGISAGGAPMRLREGAPWKADHLYACAVHQIEDALHTDTDAPRHAKPSPPPGDGTPLTNDAARAIITPHLQRYEDFLSGEPMRHFNVAWHILRAGRYPPPSSARGSWILTRAALVRRTPRPPSRMRACFTTRLIKAA
ncbi:MAG: hypothetical protein AAGJ94_15640 [Pseudomonadota bacterium]